MPITIDGTGNITGLSAGGLPDLSVTNADLATNAVSASKVLDGAITTTKLGSNEQSGLCKAFVNFNGTGVVAIRASYNVSSITDNGAGNYTLNFTSALVDSNHSLVASATGEASISYSSFVSVAGARASTSASVIVSRATSPANGVDISDISVAIFR